MLPAARPQVKALDGGAAERQTDGRRAKTALVAKNEPACTGTGR
jgi:hypothetical protein